jgi:hypothetical protein
MLIEENVKDIVVTDWPGARVGVIWLIVLDDELSAVVITIVAVEVIAGIVGKTGTGSTIATASIVTWPQPVCIHGCTRTLTCTSELEKEESSVHPSDRRVDLGHWLTPTSNANVVQNASDHLARSAHNSPAH